MFTYESLLLIRLKQLVFLCYCVMGHPRVQAQYGTFQINVIILLQHNRQTLPQSQNPISELLLTKTIKIIEMKLNILILHNLNSSREFALGTN